MKKDFLGLRTAIYKVGNINKAKEWYSNILDTKPYFDESFYVGFNVGGYELGLQPKENLPAVRSDGVNAYWGVEDVKCVYKKLLDAGASAFEEPTDVGGGITVATVKDPWGNVFGIIHNPNFILP